MTRWWPLIVEVLVGWAAFVLLARWFGSVYREQSERERSQDRREAYLNAWSDELAVFDAERVERARAATVLLERALGPEPVQTDGGAS